MCPLSEKIEVKWDESVQMQVQIQTQGFLCDRKGVMLWDDVRMVQYGGLG